MVNDHCVLWPWRPHESWFKAPHILSFTGWEYNKAGLDSVLAPSPWSGVGPLILTFHWILVSPFSFSRHITLLETLFVELVSTTKHKFLEKNPYKNVICLGRHLLHKITWEKWHFFLVLGIPVMNMVSRSFVNISQLNFMIFIYQCLIYISMYIYIHRYFSFLITSGIFKNFIF